MKPFVLPKIPKLNKKDVIDAAKVCSFALAAALCAVCLLPKAPEAKETIAMGNIPVYSVDTNDKKIAISFDAAWGAEKTTQIMDILEERDIKTTFFLVGFWIDAYPDKVEEIAQRGHEIGNHSSTHPKMTTLSKEQMLMEVNACSDKIEEITGTRPTLFRPPYGDYNDNVVNTLRQNGLEVIQWSVDSLDWKNLGVQPMIDKVTKNVEPGSIVLFHNNSDHILEALPTILDTLIEKGYEIVPISELLIDGVSHVDRAGVLKSGSN